MQDLSNLLAEFIQSKTLFFTTSASSAFPVWKRNPAISFNVWLIEERSTCLVFSFYFCQQPGSVNWYLASVPAWLFLFDLRLPDRSGCRGWWRRLVHMRCRVGQMGEWNTNLVPRRVYSKHVKVAFLPQCHSRSHQSLCLHAQWQFWRVTRYTTG